MRTLSSHRNGGGPIMNLISGTYNFCERKEYAFNVLPEYSIITPELLLKLIKHNPFNQST